MDPETQGEYLQDIHAPAANRQAGRQVNFCADRLNIACLPFGAWWPRKGVSAGNTVYGYLSELRLQQRQLQSAQGN